MELIELSEELHKILELLRAYTRLLHDHDK